MANIDLSKYGITGTTEIVHNPSYETLYEEETKADLKDMKLVRKVNSCSKRNDRYLYRSFT